MSLDKKILSEIQRYKSINNYIREQAGDDLAALAPEEGAAPPPPPADALATPPPPPAPGGAPTPIDVDNDPDVEKIDDDGKSEEGGTESGSEELDITELVDSQKNIEKKQDEMEKTGKNDYVLTPQDVTDINVNDIKGSFQGSGQKDELRYK
jgi:hypothetical protein